MQSADDVWTGSMMGFWFGEIDAVEHGFLNLGNHFSKRSISIMMLIAIQHNRTMFINKVLDFKQIPKDGLSFKERLTIYQLT